MGLGGISIWQLVIILVIVVLLFGTKRLGSMGSDLGAAIRGFRKSMQDEPKPEDKRLPGEEPQALRTRARKGAALRVKAILARCQRAHTRTRLHAWTGLELAVRPSARSW